MKKWRNARFKTISLKKHNETACPSNSCLYTVCMDNQGSDIVIVTTVLSGDVDAFEVIIDRYSNAFQRYICRLGVVPPDDEDVLQEVFLKIYKNLNDFNPSYKFSSWAYRIAHNEAVSYSRKRRKMYIFHNDAEKRWFWDGVLDEHDPTSMIIDAEDMSAHEDTKKWLVDVLNSLDNKYSNPIILYFFEGKQYEEISDILRIPVSTVGTRIRRAKEKIRLLFNERDV